jgi:hypothetical protein
VNDNKQNPASPPASVGETEKPDLAAHFIQRTDADFSGKPDKSLIGRDIPIEEYDADELDEDGEPL